MSLDSLRSIFSGSSKVSGWLKDVVFTGFAGVALAMVYQVFDTLRHQPELLAKNGITFILWFAGIVLIALLFNQAITGITESGSRLAESSAATAAAMQQMASSIQQMAEKDDRQYDETKRMSQYSAQRSDRAVELIEQQNTMLSEFIAECRAQRGRDGAS